MTIERKRTIIYLFSIAFLAIFSILLLFYVRGDFNKKNGFNRRIILNPIILVSKIKNVNRFTEICGSVDHSLYFSNQNPDTIFIAGENLQRERKLAIPLHNKKIESRFETIVDTSRIFIFAGNVPAIYLTNSNSISSIKTFSLPAIYGRSQLISADTILLRIVKKQNDKLDMVFALYNLRDNSLLYETKISELHGDVGFSTDGLLHYDKTTGIAVFVEFYRNRIIAFTTKLKVLYKGHTIDTVSINATNYNSMKVRNVNEYTNSSPKRVVNLESCTDRGLLYVQSMLQADNEENKSFLNNSVIDVYSVKNGAYKGSFYVPVDNGRKFYKFRIFGNLLVALYKDHISTYLLKFQPTH